MADLNAGLLTKLLPSGQSPTYNAVPLDPGTQGLITQDTNLASQPSSTFADQINSNVQARADQGKQSDQQLNNEANSTNTSQGQLSAIRNQYQAEASKGIGRIMDQNQIQGQMNKYQLTQQMTQAAMAQQNVETQNYEQLTQAYNQSLMARAQVLSSVLGAGGVAGAVAMRGGRRNSTSPLSGTSTQTNSNNGSALA